MLRPDGSPEARATVRSLLLSTTAAAGLVDNGGGGGIAISRSGFGMRTGKLFFSAITYNCVSAHHILYLYLIIDSAKITVRP